jgi:putative chitinase
MNLSKNFSFAELTHTDHRSLDNTPNEGEIENLRRLAAFLELVKTQLGGRAVLVNSAFRSAAVNAAVGSSDKSQHRLGTAADIRVPGMTPDEVVRSVMTAGLPYDQIIREFSDPEKGGGWTHISIPSFPSLPPRRMALIIDKNGTRKFS